MAVDSCSLKASYLHQDTKTDTKAIIGETLQEIAEEQISRLPGFAQVLHASQSSQGGTRKHKHGNTNGGHKRKHLHLRKRSESSSNRLGAAHRTTVPAGEQGQQIKSESTVILFYVLIMAWQDVLLPFSLENLEKGVHRTRRSELSDKDTDNNNSLSSGCRRRGGPPILLS